jgi:hypothetical protein
MSGEWQACSDMVQRIDMKAAQIHTGIAILKILQSRESGFRQCAKHWRDSRFRENDGGALTLPFCSNPNNPERPQIRDFLIQSKSEA